MIHPSERQTDGRAIAYTRAIACMLSRVKTTDLPIPPLFETPLGGTPWNFWIKLNAHKLEGWGYRVVKIS